MERRDFFKALSMAGLAPLFIGAPSVRAATNGRVLVLVFMRGGWDGLNVVVPFGDDEYYRIRPTISVSPPSASGALNIDGFFGFHPELKEVFDLYQSGWVSIMPAVHYPNGSRSHFSGQDNIESGGYLNDGAGWLGRYLRESIGDPWSRAISIADQAVYSLRGLSMPVPSYPDLNSLAFSGSVTESALMADAIARSYQWGGISGSQLESRLKEIGQRLSADLVALQNVSRRPVDNDAVYPDSTFGRQLRQAAAVIKGRHGVELITLNCNGWDTHSDQGGGAPTGRMSQLLRDFSKAVGAFFKDLGVVADRALILTSSEFGRTAVENGSKGTDHGNATVWLAMGPAVRGGIYLGGGWPGLRSSQLVEQRSLAHTLDFRSVYSEVLSNFIGYQGGAVFPGFSGSRAGFLI